jgi:AcrR family transcriptional regulator
MDGNNVTNNNIVTNYKEARARSREALRRGLLDAAGRLLTSEGPGALRVRRVAREVNCSTKVIYTMFGGKEGLVEELYLEGFERLGGALEAVPHGENPLAYLGALGRAYRESALANPTHYAVMFGRPIPEFTPSPSSLRRARSTFEVLEEAVSWCMEAGILERGIPRRWRTCCGPRCTAWSTWSSPGIFPKGRASGCSHGPCGRLARGFSMNEKEVSHDS